jgi:hypothetical protein
MLKMVDSYGETLAFEDEKGNGIIIHEDGTPLEASFDGVVYEAWGASNSTYWKKVGKSGKVSKAFDEWLEEVKNQLNEQKADGKKAIIERG